MSEPIVDEAAPVVPSKGELSPGRKLGSKNKRSKAIDEIFASCDYNAVVKLIWLSDKVAARLSAISDERNQEGGVAFANEETREDERLFLSINKTLLEYQYPKLRSVEVSAARFSGVQFVINAGSGKSNNGTAWVEESLTENLAIAEKKAAERAKEEGAHDSE